MHFVGCLAVFVGLGFIGRVAVVEAKRRHAVAIAAKPDAAIKRPRPSAQALALGLNQGVEGV